MYKIWRNCLIVFKNGLIYNLDGTMPSLSLVKRNKHKRYCFKKMGKIWFVHQIIAECFHPNWFPGCVVHHLDEDGTNNNFANLYVCINNAEHNKLFHLKQCQKNIKKATKAAASKPITEKQREARRKNALKATEARLKKRICAG